MKIQTLPYCLIFLTAWGCKEKYELPYNGPTRGYLVVEGFINSGTGATNIRLSRSLALVDSATRRNETGATVSVEGKDNSKYVLTDKGQGLYSLDQLALNANGEYRLHIITKNGGDYFSEYTTVKRTPDIDTITWERPGKGVEIFVNTHDPQNNTRYYRWEYEETWEFHSPYYSLIQYVYNTRGHPFKVEARPPESADTLFYCWKTENSTTILIGSSSNFSTDSIHLALKFIPNDDWRFGVLYSILLKQYAISAEEYEFLRRIKKNTEQTGSLFDAQPSELNGNIHNINDPDEIVVGFIGITEAKEKRRFIKSSEVPDWHYFYQCETSVVGYGEDQLTEHRFDVPIQVKDLSLRGDTISILTALYTCSDCSYRGSNKKPSFWP